MPPRARVLLWLLLLVATLAVGAEQKPAPTEWSLSSDMDANPAVVLRKGESREEVLRDLGKPRRIKRPKKVPDSEILYFRRSVLGPLKQSTVRGSPGMTIRTRILYIDEVEVRLDKGVVVAVDVTRRLSELSQ